MKRKTYVVLDGYGSVQAQIHTTDDETPTLDPWMVENIRSRGWVLQKWETEHTGETFQTHGWVNWYQVAQSLAEPLRELHDLLNKETGNEEEDQVALAEVDANAEQALQDFDISMLEVMVISPDVEPEEEG